VSSIVCPYCGMSTWVDGRCALPGCEGHDPNATEPSLPYAGTEGWSGSDTSRERAYGEASDGTASERQRAVLDLLSRQEGDGVTWSEVAYALNLHHGQASGSLSALHHDDRIVRLKERRGRSQIYVLPQYAGERQTAPYKPNRDNRHTVWQEGYIAGHDDGRHGTVTPNPYPETP